jgi:BMFP domain-containing protein YqiC
VLQTLSRFHPAKIPVTKAFSANDALNSAKDALNPALDALNQFAAKFDSALKNSPLSGLERNARQQFISQLAKQGLVTREEYEVQVALLERARAKLVELESKIALLEKERQQ